MARLLLKRHFATCGACLLPPILIGGTMGFLRPVLKEHYAVLARSLEIARSFMPKSLQQMDLFTPEGAFAWPFLHPFTLILLTVVVAIPATAWPAGERARGGLDLILAGPVGRRPLLLTVISFLLLVAALAGLAPLLGSFIGALICGEQSLLPWMTYVLVAANLFALGALFASIAVLVSVHSEDRGIATLRYGVVVVMFLLVDLLGGLWPKGEWIRKLSPFGYFDPYGALKSWENLPRDLGILVACSIVIAALAVHGFVRRARA